MTPCCANCTGIVAENTGRQFGTAWLDDWCLASLVNRGYLVGIDRPGPGRIRTPLSFLRNGKMVTFLAPRDYWHKRRTYQVLTWLDKLDDSLLQPFQDYKKAAERA